MFVALQAQQMVVAAWLQGLFPRTWLQTASTNVQYLHLDSNQALSGCVPLPNLIELTYAGTQVAGKCDDSSNLPTLRQRAALRLLPKLLLGAGKDRTTVNTAIQRLVNRNSELGRLVGNGEVEKVVWESLGVVDVRLEVVVAVVAGAEHVTAIRIDPLPDLYIGLNMTKLVAVLRDLPYLRELRQSVLGAEATRVRQRCAYHLACQALQCVCRH
jgi:hypothetical protein